MRCRWGLVATALTLTSPALADDAARREACGAAYEDAQRAMRESRLIAARERLAVCVEDVCAAFVRASCSQWLDELTARLPSVVVSLSRRDGQPINDVTVSVDGAPWNHWVGKPHEIDPGEHTFRAEGPGLTPKVVRAFVRERERAQLVTLELTDPEHGPIAPIAPETISRPVPPLAIVLGGVSVLALGGFATFAALGTAGQSDLDRCRGACDQEAVDRVHGRYVTADVFLGVAVLSLGVSAVVYLTRPSVVTRTAWSGVRF